jgi:DNA-binding NarL/FixJ family response regulator
MADAQTVLTATELVVADLAARGKADHEIADELGVASATVERHLAHAYAKLGVRSRAELITRIAAGGST